MEIKITKEVSKIQIREGINFLDIDINTYGYISDVTSNYPFEAAIQDLLEMNSDDYSDFLLLLTEGRKQIKLVENGEF